MSISLAMPCYLGQAVEHLLIAGDMVDHGSGGTATCNRWYSLNRVLGWIWVSEVSEDVNVFLIRFLFLSQGRRRKKHDTDDATSLNYGVAFCPLNCPFCLRIPCTC